MMEVARLLLWPVEWGDGSSREGLLLGSQDIKDRKSPDNWAHE